MIGKEIYEVVRDFLVSSIKDLYFSSYSMYPFTGLLFLIGPMTLDFWDSLVSNDLLIKPFAALFPSTGVYVWDSTDFFN